IGLPSTRNIGLGTSLVSSFIRVPLPAVRMTAFMRDPPMKAPRSKVQIPNKIQAPNPKTYPSRGPGAWSLGFLWSLDMGHWTFRPRRSGPKFVEHLRVRLHEADE